MGVWVGVDVDCGEAMVGGMLYGGVVGGKAVVGDMFNGAMV